MYLNCRFLTHVALAGDHAIAGMPFLGVGLLVVVAEKPCWKRAVDQVTLNAVLLLLDAKTNSDIMITVIRQTTRYYIIATRLHSFFFVLFSNLYVHV